MANYTYSYDLASRLTQEQDNGTTTNYGYDNTNELTSAGGTNYSYDLNGNRTMTGYVTGTENQITNDGVWTYTYDAEGNITQKSKGSSAETWTFGYDNLNHLIWAQDRSTPGGTLTLAATYTYDVFGNRIEKDVWQTGGSPTTTRFAYDGQDVWADLSGSNALQTRYIRGDVVDQIFARVSSGGTAAWYLTDRQGSVRNLTDASGTLQDTITYDGFGNVASESNSSFGDRYKYTAREFDSETGLQYNRRRYYSAAIGRWTSQDPIGFDAGDNNLYRYVRNDPVNATDPTGLVGWEPKHTWDHHFQADDKAHWCKIQKDGWRLKDEHEAPSGGKDFTSTDNINVEVKDKKMLKMLIEGTDIQWVNDEWAVDFTNKRIWIDAFWESSAYEYLRPLLKNLADSNQYDVDVYSGKSTKDRLNELVGLAAVFEDQMPKTVKERRTLITLLKLRNKKYWDIVGDLAPTAAGGRGLLRVLKAAKAIYQANNDAELADKVESIIEKIESQK